MFQKVKISKILRNFQTLKFFLISKTVRERAKWTKIFEMFRKLKTLKLALISETVRDRAKQTKIWDHTYCT